MVHAVMGVVENVEEVVAVVVKVHVWEPVKEVAMDIVRVVVSIDSIFLL